MMGCKIIGLAATLTILANVAAVTTCPKNDNCVCRGGFVQELKCNIDGQAVIINSLTDTYVNVVCDNPLRINYEKFPKLSATKNISLKSVSFKDCPLPKQTYKRVLDMMGVSKTMSLIIQNSKNWTGNLDRKHFAGLGDLRKLLLSFGGATTLPDNLFMDLNNLTWLNIRWRGQNLSENLFKPLEKLETLEISHNHLTNISSSLFTHLTLLRKLSLWQSNVTGFSEDLFSGVDVLEELDLSSNGLNELPETIFNPLKNLRRLTLFSNKFSSLPSKLFQKNKWLDSVIIFNNDVKLPILPRRLFSRLYNLNEVYFQRCGIEVIPYDLFYDSTEIKNISFAYNDLKALPKYVFNDQIHLLELDLSHNKIEVVDSKMFSSMVKLEVLKLNHNYIQEIPGRIFYPLLSLVVLDLEHNRLNKIWSNAFTLNIIAEMTINLAYNNLTFSDPMAPVTCDKKWSPKKLSPLATIFSLKMLNLSHNSISESFEDWWKNGHENVDISYNNLTHLSKCFVNKLIKKPVKQIWLSHNPLQCDCSDYQLLYGLQEINTKVYDFTTLNCTFYEEMACSSNAYFVLMIPVLMILLIMGYIFTKERFGSVMCKIFQEASMPVILYAGNDEKFVFQEFLHEMTPSEKYSEFRMKVASVSEKFSTNQFLFNVFFVPKNIIIFSSNYLTLKYQNVDIKKIRGEMNKNSTLYIFVDTGPDNSIYAFLKEHRDPNASLVWKEPKFWVNFFKFFSNGEEIACEELNNIITEQHNQDDVIKNNVAAINLT